MRNTEYITMILKNVEHTLSDTNVKFSYYIEKTKSETPIDALFNIISSSMQISVTKHPFKQ